MTRLTPSHPDHCSVSFSARGDSSPQLSNSIRSLVLYQRLEPPQSLIPSRRHVIQILPRRVNRLRLELEQALPAATHRVDKPGAFQHPKMLRNCLPGQPRPLRQLRDGLRLAAAQFDQQRQPRLVAQRRKHRRLRRLSRDPALTIPVRRIAQCSSPARSSHPRSYAGPRRGARSESCRSRIP